MLVVGFVCFFVGFVLIICYPINKSKNARCTAQTQGVLSEVRKRYNSKGNLKDMHVYTYHVNGVQYNFRTLDHSLQVSKVGDVCTIWYNPARPGDAQAFRGTEKYLKTILIVGIGLLWLGIILTIVGFYQQFILPALPSHALQ